MPTYAYLCAKCGHEFELFQSMKDKAITVCPKDRCGQKRWGKGRVSRQLGTGAGLLFKGSGFYITDYRSEGYKQAAKKESTPAPTTAPTAVEKPKATAGSSSHSHAKQSKKH
jgi:putative FmdB family regulatory protein